MKLRSVVSKRRLVQWSLCWELYSFRAEGFDLGSSWTIPPAPIWTHFSQVCFGSLSPLFIAPRVVVKQAPLKCCSHSPMLTVILTTAHDTQGQEHHHKPKNVTLILLHSSQVEYAKKKKEKKKGL